MVQPGGAKKLSKLSRIDKGGGGGGGTISLPIPSSYSMHRSTVYMVVVSGVLIIKAPPGPFG